MSNIFFKKGKYINNIYNKLKKNINKKNNNLGQIRQFPPANLEWSNSIYAYNKNYIKFLPSFDKIVTKLIKSYFYLHDIKKGKKKSSTRRMRIRLKRLSINRIFVSKAEIKHTNTKAIVTIYIYNAEKRYLLNKLKKFVYSLSLYNINLKEIINKNKNKLSDVSLINLIKLKTLNIKKLYRTISYLSLKFKKPSNKTTKIKNIYKYFLIQQYEILIKSFIKKSIRKEKLYIYYKYLLWFNKSKFENTYIYPLNKLIKKFYNKKIEFNLVNLKYLHLNSNIFTEFITIKLKKRKNYLLKVLNVCLSKIKLPIYNKNSDMFSSLDKWEKKKQLFFNNVKGGFKLISRLSPIKRSNINKNVLENKDFLHQYMQLLYIQKRDVKENSLISIILNSIRRKTISGVRIEASGRLSRRLIAARSVFKFRYIGTLRNINSSYKGLPSVMLRGNFKSNIQYTKISSKTRNGSFGLKGWVSTL